MRGILSCWLHSELFPQKAYFPQDADDDAGNDDDDYANDDDDAANDDDDKADDDDDDDQAGEWCRQCAGLAPRSLLR